MGWRERQLARRERKAKRRQRNNFGLRCLALAVRLRQGRQLADYKRREEITLKQLQARKQRLAMEAPYAYDRILNS